MSSLNKFGWIKVLANLFLVAVLLVIPQPHFSANAQGEQPAGPVYVVQPGDTFWDISLRFRVSLNDLSRANPQINRDLLKVGDRLVIPGFVGVQGTLVTQPVGFGESLRALGRRYQVDPDLLARLNRLTSPLDLYAGMNLILLEQQPLTESSRLSLKPGQSLLELAVLAGESPWTLASRNGFSQTAALPEDVLLAAGEEGSSSTGPLALPETIREIEINSLNLVQGKTMVLRVQTNQPIVLSGSFDGRTLNFFPEGENTYTSLQGVHALAQPGGYPLTLSGTWDDGSPFEFVQMMRVVSGDYPFEDLIVAEITLDPAVTRPEDEQWKALTAPVTPERFWEGTFGFPSPLVFYDCWPSTFGRRRSYNQSGYIYFHTGLDVCGSTGTEIFAPAEGEVIFTGFLTVRGNATVINHGWGVYSAYMHQSESLVKIGDQVETGQLIGRVGATGRVTGPHLHWEIWAGGVQVDPMDWLNEAYP